eukprot:8668223-Pyramimonas_sp.AAC.1
MMLRAPLSLLSWTLFPRCVCALIIALRSLGVLAPSCLHCLGKAGPAIQLSLAALVGSRRQSKAF